MTGHQPTHQLRHETIAVLRVSGHPFDGQRVKVLTPGVNSTTPVVMVSPLSDPNRQIPTKPRHLKAV